jgi:integrase/recombinase XerD
MNQNQPATVIQFPTNPKPRNKKKERIKNVDGVKYFNPNQIKMIRRRVRDQAEIDEKKGNLTGVKEWMVIDLLTSTGVRVSEAANLRIGDLRLGYGESSVFVRKGKGDISGHVVIPDSLKKHLRGFIGWKNSNGEPIGEEDHLFIGQRGPWTSQAIQQIVKKYLKELNLYQKGKSVHSLRHSYAVELYSKEKDIRAVQKQLRHVSLQSTLVYADVTDEMISNQVKGLWN